MALLAIGVHWETPALHTIFFIIKRTRTLHTLAPRKTNLYLLVHCTNTILTLMHCMAFTRNAKFTHYRNFMQTLSCHGKKFEDACFFVD